MYGYKKCFIFETSRSFLGQQNGSDNRPKSDRFWIKAYNCPNGFVFNKD